MINNLNQLKENKKMKYPEKSCIVEIKTKKKPIWRLAMFYWNGKTPIFAQYGSDVNNVTEWRYKEV